MTLGTKLGMIEMPRRTYMNFFDDYEKGIYNYTLYDQFDKLSTPLLFADTTKFLVLSQNKNLILCSKKDGFAVPYGNYN